MDKHTKEKVERLKKKQEILKARIQLIESREKSKERKLETRKKILVGSYFIAKYTEEDKIEELKNIMDKYLSRESDRKTFELMPRDDDGVKNNEK